ncbi:unnamed protein product [Effrenium voratum]|nr:unnamed protein product [Effrenium voratum]
MAFQACRRRGFLACLVCATPPILALLPWPEELFSARPKLIRADVLGQRPAALGAASGVRKDPHEYLFHGLGACETGYYAGWHSSEAADLDTCKAACSREPQCAMLSFKQGVACGRFDATSGGCHLQWQQENYSSYLKWRSCDWATAEVLEGHICGGQYGDWRTSSNQTVQALLASCSSTPRCKGLIWWRQPGKTWLNASKSWFKVCTSDTSRASAPWSFIKNPCAVPPEDERMHRELTRTSAPEVCEDDPVAALPPPVTGPGNVELVISAFNENLSFIEPLTRTTRTTQLRVRIYCTDPSLDPRCEAVPDKGGENFVYLKHIVDNYDRLANVTIFSVGSIMRNHNDQLLCRKLNFLLDQLGPLTGVGFPGFSTMAHTFPGEFNPFNPFFDIEKYNSQKWGRIKLCEPSVRPLGAWYQHFLGDLRRPLCNGVLFNGIFAASSARLRRWPKETYQRLMDELGRCGELRSVADHFMERAWKGMLDDGGGPVKGHANQCPIEELVLQECFRKENGRKDSCPPPNFR